MELITLKIFDEYELINDFKVMFAMVMKKINININQWYYQIWMEIAEKNSIKLNDEQCYALKVLYKDLEIYFIKNCIEVKD